MQCPNDQTTLAMTERQGIEIDYCPTCRGVWLDKGELDKLIANSEASTPMTQAPEQRSYQQPQQSPPPYRDDRPRAGYDVSGYYGKKKKKESFIGDLFDF